jgi:exonuclease SbcD
MKILHTSDWHIGRTFHGHPTTAALRTVLDAVVAIVGERSVDVVVVSGDIFDSASPAAENYVILTDVLRALRSAGAVVVMTSGNHDSATRLGFQSEFAQLAGIHVITRPDDADRPVTIADEHGPVHFYGIPFLEPSLVRHRYPEEVLRTHSQVLSFVMGQIRADAASRGGRSVVLSHCFAAGVSAEASDVERDITAGGLDLVPLDVFDGPDYVALGHIHGRSTLSPRARYSGAPLHYSFSEAAKPRGAWLVALDAGGLEGVEWIDLPVPRPLAVLTGTIGQLLEDAAHSGAEESWVAAVLTDRVRPLDGMRRLQSRFPFCVCLEHRPVEAGSDATTYSERVRSKTDPEIVAGFLEHVRNGMGPTDFERDLVNELIAERAGADAAL